jgi:hypothetical protein
MVVNSNKTRMGHVFINIKDSVFESNGDINTDTPRSSILWLNSYNDDINMKMQNVSFTKNSLLKNGMVFVNNEYGTTNTSLLDVLLVENGYHNIGISNSLLLFNQVFNVVLKIEFCRVHRSACRFLQLAAQTVQIIVLNTEVISSTLHPKVEECLTLMRAVNATFQLLILHSAMVKILQVDVAELYLLCRQGGLLY